MNANEVDPDDDLDEPEVVDAEAGTASLEELLDALEQRAKPAGLLARRLNSDRLVLGYPPDHRLIRFVVANGQVAEAIKATNFESLLPVPGYMAFLDVAADEIEVRLARTRGLMPRPGIAGLPQGHTMSLSPEDPREITVSQCSRGPRTSSRRTIDYLRATGRRGLEVSSATQGASRPGSLAPVQAR